MYKCEKHGVLEKGWCDDCSKTIQCDCTDIKETRVKDVEYLYGEDFHSAYITLYIKHCHTCGEFLGAKK